jgi:RNase P/RNase MRP subunit p29
MDRRVTRMVVFQLFGLDPMNASIQKRLRRAAASAILASGLIGSAVFAQTPPSTGIRGAITSVSGEKLVVKTNRGAEQTVMLDKDTRVAAISIARIDDIKPGSYIGAAGIPQPDGSQKALEVHVFPPSMAGTGDGYRPFDLTPNSTMTNGSVGDVVGSSGRTLTLKYKGGEKKIVVPEDVPIVNIEAGDRSMLVAGAKVVLRARKNPDGSMTALSVNVGKNGITPPM